VIEVTHWLAQSTFILFSGAAIVGAVIYAICKEI
jgi:hypothetical protein